MVPFAPTSLFKRLWLSVRTFRSGTTGNVAITFSLALIPVFAFVGAAVDYSRASSARAEMQNVLDATALMLAKAAPTLTQDQLQQKANDYFNAMFHRPGTQNVTVTPAYDATTSTVTITSSGTVPTTVLGILGIKQINVSTSGTITWGTSRLRVALVLDNTGSMAASNKMTALKTATQNLLDQLKAAATNNGDVYVSLIPFTKDVNVDPVNYSQSWVRWDLWDNVNGSCSNSNYTTQATCTGVCSNTSYTTQSTCTASGNCSDSQYTSQSTCTASGSCSDSQYTTQSTCVANGHCSKKKQTTPSTCATHSGTWTQNTWTANTWIANAWTAYTWTADNHNTWNGCVTDRDQNYDTNNTAASSGTPATMYPAEQYGVCPVAMMGLTYDWTALKNKVTAMTPAGNTNQAIGLQMGWQTLTAAPFTVPTMDSNYKYNQVIILLTDGLNTQDRWYTAQASIDARQQITCNNINAANITLYAIQVNTGGDPTSTLLQNCAGSPGTYPDPSKFFLLTSSSEIVSVFKQIGTAITQLHIAR